MKMNIRHVIEVFLRLSWSYSSPPRLLSPEQHGT